MRRDNSESAGTEKVLICAFLSMFRISVILAYLYCFIVLFGFLKLFGSEHGYHNAIISIFLIKNKYK